MDEIKDLLKSLVNLAMTNQAVNNDKGEEMDKDKEVENAKVDKRDIIRQIMAIAGKHEDNEDVRTIAKLAEKLAYDKSEAGTADNADDDDKEKVEEKETKKEVKEEKKEDVDNKCKNSVDNAKPSFFDRLNEVYNTALEPPKQDIYVSQADRLAAADEYFK